MDREKTPKRKLSPNNPTNTTSMSTTTTTTPPVDSIDPEARDLLTEIIDRAVKEESENGILIDDDQQMVSRLVSAMVDRVVDLDANNNPQQQQQQQQQQEQTVGADNASGRPYRPIRHRPPTKSIGTPTYTPPEPVITDPISPKTDRRSWSVDNLYRLDDQLSADFYKEVEPKAGQPYQQQQLRQLAPRQPSFFDTPAGSGPRPHLFMSALDGYVGKGSGSPERRKGSRRNPIKGELFQHNADTIESTLSVDDYQQLCLELADYGFNLDNQNIIGRGTRGTVVTDS
ncbi:uncharacterized protein LOC128956869 isoform X2 [Oppia nitens]|uniref:uncharacterized protein LOC128956869 isoform X2 n=1 Tax=Oppia nitens TaxID=1686743 RepID=UPI0023DCB0F3|nr:uncharacterized protein LOC128956869 isoform X2 [Oppia nitens]